MYKTLAPTATTNKMKNEKKKHHDRLVNKSCLKYSASSRLVPGHLDETENSSWNQSSDVLGKTLAQTDDLAVITITTEKKVHFAKKASCKKTITLEQFTKQEHHDTWYTHEELCAIYRTRAKVIGENVEEDHDADVMCRQRKPRASSSCPRRAESPAAPRHLPRRRKWSAVLTSSASKASKPIKEGSTKDRSRLMGLTSQHHHWGNKQKQTLPTSCCSIVRCRHESPVHEKFDGIKKESTLSSRNHELSSIFRIVQKKLQLRSRHSIKKGR